jgi:hypothetical protein
VFIIIDAIDECQGKDSIRAEFLDSIRRIKPFANTLVTSRHIAAIEEAFKGEPQEEIRVIDKNITTYVEAEIRKSFMLSNELSSKPALQKRYSRTGGLEGQRNVSILPRNVSYKFTYPFFFFLGSCLRNLMCSHWQAGTTFGNFASP